MFEEWKATLLKNQGLESCPMPITYGEGDLRAAFKFGLESAAEICTEKAGTGEYGYGSYSASAIAIRKEISDGC